MVESIEQSKKRDEMGLGEKRKVADSLQFDECHVGIELFYSDTLPDSEKKLELASLECSFKHRFSDFVVNEIDQSGEVVWYRKEENLQMWKPANMSQTMPEEIPEEEEKEEKKSDGMTLYPEVMEELSELLCEVDYKSLIGYIDGLKSGAVPKD